MDNIVITGARENNLKNINLSLPKNKLIVFTGLSGSGKSSLAMDTIYAEGQRRYVESLSSYARQFLGVLKKPDVDKIEGLSPSIAIDQKTVSKNPRSTVGTITEIYDYLRLLYSKIGVAHCPSCGDELKPQTIDQITDNILKSASEFIKKDTDMYKILICSVPVNYKKGEYDNLFKVLKKQGWYDIRIDSQFFDLKKAVPDLDRNKKHLIEVVVDRIVISQFDLNEGYKSIRSKIFETIDSCLKIDPSFIRIFEVLDRVWGIHETPTNLVSKDISTTKTCLKCNISLPDFEPRHFSFNSPMGACPVCNGLGEIKRVDPKKIIDENLSIFEGGIIPYTSVMQKDGWLRKIIIEVAKVFDIPLKYAISNISKEKIEKLLYGTGSQKYQINYISTGGLERTVATTYEGVIPNLERRYIETNSDYIRAEIEKYMTSVVCEECHGARLKKEVLSVLIDGKSISDITSLSIDRLLELTNDLLARLTKSSREIAKPIIQEIYNRTKFLVDVGLSYLTLGRSADTLSGGESQRIRLASQIGTGLTGVLYVLDEPSIGLHSRDQRKLIDSLKGLRDLGNTVIVVEHDRDTMFQSDLIVDFGPGAGVEGGKIVATGDVKKIMDDKNSITGPYLKNEKLVHRNVENLLKVDNSKFTKFEHDTNAYIFLEGVKTNNLKNVSVKFPLGKLTCVTGVSGSGKSSLVVETLLPALRRSLNYYSLESLGLYEKISGYEKLDRIIFVDQSPIGKTPRSNPATYTKVFDDIRELFSLTRQAKTKGYDKSRFSFNLRGGRCESCKGEGKIKIEMQFMPDVYIDCDVCKGNRYVSEVLDIKYRGKNIADVLNMSVDEAYNFFEGSSIILEKLLIMKKVGLGYIKLGQPAPLLSGGESQRIKLSSELYRRSNGRSLYVLDEPTTGLHFKDMEKLLTVLKSLVFRGDTVIVIEHNLDFISMADWIIDIGPEGGDNGGNIVFEGTVEGIKKCGESWTGKMLSGM